MRNGRISEAPFLFLWSRSLHLGRELKATNDLAPGPSKRKELAGGAIKSVGEVAAKAKNVLLRAHPTILTPLLFLLVEPWSYKSRMNTLLQPFNKQSRGWCSQWNDSRKWEKASWILSFFDARDLLRYEPNLRKLGRARNAFQCWGCGPSGPHGVSNEHHDQATSFLDFLVKALNASCA